MIPLPITWRNYIGVHRSAGLEMMILSCMKRSWKADGLDLSPFWLSVDAWKDGRHVVILSEANSRVVLGHQAIAEVFNLGSWNGSKSHAWETEPYQLWKRHPSLSRHWMVVSHALSQYFGWRNAQKALKWQLVRLMTRPFINSTQTCRLWLAVSIESNRNARWLGFYSEFYRRL